MVTKHVKHVLPTCKHKNGMFHVDMRRFEVTYHCRACRMTMTLPVYRGAWLDGWTKAGKKGDPKQLHIPQPTSSLNSN